MGGRYSFRCLRRSGTLLHAVACGASRAWRRAAAALVRILGLCGAAACAVVRAARARRGGGARRVSGSAGAAAGATRSDSTRSFEDSPCRGWPGVNGPRGTLRDPQPLARNLVCRFVTVAWWCWVEIPARRVSLVPRFRVCVLDCDLTAAALGCACVRACAWPSVCPVVTKKGPRPDFAGGAPWWWVARVT